MNHYYQFYSEDRKTTIIDPQEQRKRLNFQSEDQVSCKNDELEAGTINSKQKTRAASEFIESSCHSLNLSQFESIMSDFNKLQPLVYPNDFKKSLVEKINGRKPQISSEKKFINRRLSFFDEEYEQNLKCPKKIRINSDTRINLNFEIENTCINSINGFDIMIPSKQGYFSEFETIALLGEGHNGKVFLCRKNKDSRYYAVKCTKTPMKSIQKVHQQKEAINEIKNLVTLQSRSQCHNLVQIFEYWKEDQIIFMSLEFCENSLAQIHRQKEIISENEIKKVLFDVLVGLQHMHNHQLVHMDIKPENILYSISQNRYKITDFGMTRCQRVKPGENFSEGDSRYSAEELLNVETIGSDDLSSADVFSLGATLYQLMTDQELPSYGPQRKALRSGIILGHIGYSNELKNLVIQMMHPDPKQRPKIIDILYSEYIRKEYIYYHWRQIQGLIMEKELKKIQELINF